MRGAVPFGAKISEVHKRDKLVLLLAPRREDEEDNRVHVKDIFLVYDRSDGALPELCAQGGAHSAAG